MEQEKRFRTANEDRLLGARALLGFDACCADGVSKGDEDTKSITGDAEEEAGGGAGED